MRNFHCICRNAVYAVLLLFFPATAPVFSAQETDRMAGRLASCPDSPNCVSSDAANPTHHIPPLAISLPANEAWRLISESVKEMPRTKIVDISDNYLHAECTSLVFRFVDDLQIELRVGGWGDRRPVGVADRS